MRIQNLRQADLNLLVVFTVLAEERNVTRAASRLLLTQPAVSRSLQRLRVLFHDDLLVRSPAGYEPTPKGQRLLRELESTLPRLDRLLSGSDFNPDTEEAAFRVAVTDHAAQVLCPLLARSLLRPESRVSFEFTALHDGTFEAMERGRLDLLLNADDGYLPPRFAREVIFEDEFACVVSRASHLFRAVTLKQYVDARHVGVGILGGLQTIPDKRLAAIGAHRHCPLTVPYFATALRAVAGTDLIATVPGRMAHLERDNPALRILRPPEILGKFQYLMAWHPRMSTDGAHLWLRDTIRKIGQAL
ncbi:LysR family transcriptional regulator [uncultured Paludibaculum sp.]|uniref:LysR family transcriptional regulator n=1 Tax=uncultured Paludibaculum sp. TaxID=1765020 RepID=UPI002AAAAB6D|nr:LysR family transcriptional regulator [uncultured Paludibaculum sp.]